MRGAGRQRGRMLCLPEPPQIIEQIARGALEPFVEGISCASNRRYGSRRIVVSGDIPHQVELSAPPLRHHGH